jgi:hypothetical protein
MLLDIYNELWYDTHKRFNCKKLYECG